MLYEIYRPSKFEDLVGQEYTSEILKNQIKTGKIAHSYLMCGTRGTGKTSTSRIMAMAVNCESPIDGEPCGQCESCKSIANGTAIDIVELDAASNRGIDKIREIKQDAQYAPATAKYKVYTIDEVHMLTNEAVSAFLKILEEPPKHVIFILATTDPQKLPITILSRCQRYDFKRIAVNKIAERLSFVCKTEKENVPHEVLELIAKVSDGAMRDALSVLEKIISINEKERSQENVSKLLSMAGFETISKLVSSILKQDMLSSLKLLNKLDDEGQDFGLFIKDLIKYVRSLMVLSVNGSDELIAATTEDISVMKQIIVNTSSEQIIFLLELLQTAESDLKLNGNAKIALETVAIKANQGKNQLMEELKTMKAMIVAMQQQMRSTPVNHVDDFNEEYNNEQNIREDGCNNEYDPSEYENAKSLAENNYEEDQARQLNPVVLAKKQIIECSRKVNRTDFANAVANSKMFMRGTNVLIFTTTNELEKEILEKNKSNLVKGFSKYLDKEVEVEVK